MKIVRIAWNTVELRSGYFQVPDDFDVYDFDMANAPHHPTMFCTNGS